MKKKSLRQLRRLSHGRNNCISIGSNPRFRNHGVIFTIVPDIGVIEGIDASRNILIRQLASWFDEEKCSKGVTSLENYRKEMGL